MHPSFSRGNNLFRNLPGKGLITSKKRRRLMKRKWVFGLLMVLPVFMFLLAAVGEAATGKDKIRVGWVTSLSGVNAPGVMVTSGNVYKVWVEEVNAKGGLNIKEYGKRLPLDVTMYDDKSDIGTMTKLLEKTIVEDKVDLIFCPWDTAFIFAAAPIANKYKMVLLGGSGGALKLKGIISKLPYFFQVLNFADYQIPALADVFAEVGVKSVYIAYIQDLHGLEYNEVAQKEFPKKNIKIVAAKSFPLDMQAFTAKGINGVMGAGAWSVKTSAGAKEFFDKYTKKWGFEPEGWGALFYYSSLQFLKQAIEEAGTLNQTKIRDVMAKKTYPTALGPFKFTNNIFIDHPGEVDRKSTRLNSSHGYISYAVFCF